MELTANCVRDGKWWIVRVPEIRGLFTQVRRLDQVSAWVLDAASMLDDQPAEGYTVTVVPRLDGADDAAVVSAKLAREQASTADQKAQEATKAAAVMLSSSGLSTRDIGSLLGVSHQRAQQLLVA